MKRPALLLSTVAALLLSACAPVGRASAEIPVQGVTVVKAYPHDTGAYTEGLFVRDGRLYESTGEIGASSIRRVDLATGKVLQQADTPAPYYGEGIIAAGDRLVQLTWRNRGGFVYDLQTFKPLGVFTYEGEGWALTSDGHTLYMSDGTPTIRKLDPDTLQQTGTIEVTADGKPLKNLNELEWVKGEIWANVWLTSRIARIHPGDGKVVGWIDLAPLVPTPEELTDPTNDVANGIAYDAEQDMLYVTGKRWPKLFEIKLKPLKRKR
ncbi:MAG: glutaminyl-peptide cyclotransferase [Pseudoxanthomonas sp.]